MDNLIPAVEQKLLSETNENIKEIVSCLLSDLKSAEGEYVYESKWRNSLKGQIYQILQDYLNKPST